MKFLMLQAQYADYAGCSEQLPPQPTPPAPITPPVNDAELFAAGVLVDFPDNPAREDYPTSIARSPTSTARCSSTC